MHNKYLVTMFLIVATNQAYSYDSTNVTLGDAAGASVSSLVATYVTLAFSLTSLGCVIYLLVIFRRWRKRLPGGDETHYLHVPDTVSDQVENAREEFASAKEQFASLIANVQKMYEQVGIAAQANKEFVAENRGDIVKALSELDEHVGTLDKVASERKAEIDRLRQGYDYVIKKSFILEIVNTCNHLKRLEKRLDSLSAEKVLEECTDAFEILLENEGIESWEPQLGTHVNDPANKGRVDPVGTKPAASDEQVGQILSVKSPCQLLDLGTGEPRVIQKSKVIIGKIQEVLPVNMGNQIKSEPQTPQQKDQ